MRMMVLEDVFLRLMTHTLVTDIFVGCRHIHQYIDGSRAIYRVSLSFRGPKYIYLKTIQPSRRGTIQHLNTNNLFTKS